MQKPILWCLVPIQTLFMTTLGCGGEHAASDEHGDVHEEVPSDAMPSDAAPNDAMPSASQEPTAPQEGDVIDGILAGDVGRPTLPEPEPTHGAAAALPAVMELPPVPGPFEATRAEDLNADADVVEVELEATLADVEVVPGTRVAMWTYNGVLPGPSIEARVGDTVRVHLTNSLPEATTIHWHGLRIPAEMDGVPAVQSPIEPGETFTYEFVVPDAGTFWYHPHMRSDEQVERGLYGAFIVRGENEPEATSEQVVVLDDLLVDAAWNLAPFDVVHAMPGRQGNVIVVNGRAHPTLTLAPGGLHRLRFINAANARYFRLALADVELTQIGTDGGLLSSPMGVEELLLVPGERADVLLRAPSETTSSTWTTLPYDRGHGTGELPGAAVFQLQVDGEPASELPDPPPTLASIEPLQAPGTQRELRLEEEESGEAGGHAGHGATGVAPVFSINGETYPDIAPLQAEIGAIEEWSLVNTTEMDHPFHLHGFRFQIVSQNGVPEPQLAWRDTINVAAEQTVVFRVLLEDNPGTWMYHCHILEHAEYGMMGELSVVGP